MEKMEPKENKVYPEKKVPAACQDQWGQQDLQVRLVVGVREVVKGLQDRQACVASTELPDHLV